MPRNREHAYGLGDLVMIRPGVLIGYTDTYYGWGMEPGMYKYAQKPRKITAVRDAGRYKLGDHNGDFYTDEMIIKVGGYQEKIEVI